MIAKDLILRAVTQLQDKGAVRWSTADLVRWLNDGQRQIAVDRPDSVAVAIDFALAVGARQTIPADSLAFIDVLCNFVSRKAVRKVAMSDLDAIEPGWQGRAGSNAIQHFTHDLREPRSFHVYPPAIAGARVELIHARAPALIDEAPSGDWTTVTGNTSVSDAFANALLDYVLYRAFAMDSEATGMAAISATHYAAFANAIGVQLKSTATVANES